MITEEDIWYFKTTGFYKVRQTLPEDLVERLNEVTSEQVKNMYEPIVWEEKGDRKPDNVRRLSKIFLRDPSYSSVTRLARASIRPFAYHEGMPNA